MYSQLQQVMVENQILMQDEVFLRLNASGVLNKHVLDEELLRERITLLIGKFLASLKGKPEVFVSYVESITDQRIDEGIVLHELQLALIVLEEKAWQLVVESIPLEDQVRCLGLITLIIGTAKDRVAHIFLHHLEMAESEASFLRRRSGFLEQGTDSPPFMEEDLIFLQNTGTPRKDHF